MSIENQGQLENAQAKLRLLEDACEKLKHKPGPNVHVDQLSLGALHSQIKQLKEEMALYATRSTERVRAR